MDNKKTSRDMLEHRIQRALTLTNLACLGPWDSKDRCQPIGILCRQIYNLCLTSTGSPKLKAMQRDPRVSFAVANPMAGWVTDKELNYSVSRDPWAGTPEWDMA